MNTKASIAAIAAFAVISGGIWFAASQQSMVKSQQASVFAANTSMSTQAMNPTGGVTGPQGIKAVITPPTGSEGAPCISTILWDDGSIYTWSGFFDKNGACKRQAAAISSGASAGVRLTPTQSAIFLGQLKAVQNSSSQASQ